MMYRNGLRRTLLLTVLLGVATIAAFSGGRFAAAQTVVAPGNGSVSPITSVAGTSACFQGVAAPTGTTGSALAHYTATASGTASIDATQFNVVPQSLGVYGVQNSAFVLVPSTYNPTTHAISFGVTAGSCYAVYAFANAAPPSSLPNSGGPASQDTPVLPFVLVGLFVVVAGFALTRRGARRFR